MSEKNFSQRAVQSQKSALQAMLRLSEEYAASMRQMSEQTDKEHSSPRKELVLWTSVAGLKYHVNLNTKKGRACLARLEPGTELVLEREPDNPYDHWAVKVLTKSGQMLGYVTRFKNETIARMMDHGHRFEARVEDKKAFQESCSKKQKTVTEGDLLPFSVWMLEDQGKDNAN